MKSKRVYADMPDLVESSESDSDDDGGAVFFVCIPARESPAPCFCIEFTLCFVFLV